MFKSLWSLAGRGAESDYVFPTVNPKEDGPDCTKDCADCTVRYPSRFKVETARPLYGHIKPFTTHLLVATGKDDWTEKVERERGSLMEALHDSPATDKYGVSYDSSHLIFSNANCLIIAGYDISIEYPDRWI